VIALGCVTAVVAGGLFALAAVLQQKMAAARPPGEQLSWRLIVQLARQRTWLIGIAVAAGSYVLQAVALSLAPLSVVQPLLTTEVIFAVPLSVRRHRVPLHPREWAAIVVVSTCLVVGLAAAAPRPGNPIVPVTSWLPALATAGALVLGALGAGRFVHGRARAAAYAIAAAVVMGVEASLMAATAARFGHGAATGFTAWETYAMAACSITVLLLIQSAFQAGPLAVSMPITDALSPATAIVLGVTLFGERLDTSVPHLVVAAAAATLLVAAIVALDTSPVVQAVHRAEAQASGATDASKPASARQADAA
jgi:drug/metabolite transporter (DMT)-like permease